MVVMTVAKGVTASHHRLNKFKERVHSACKEYFLERTSAANISRPLLIHIARHDIIPIKTTSRSRGQPPTHVVNTVTTHTCGDYGDHSHMW